MIVLKAQFTYSQNNEEEFRRAVREADRKTRKIGQNIDLGREEITLLSPSGDRFALVVSDSGALGVEARA